MTLELTLRVVRRLRQLTDEEFEALEHLVNDGKEPADEALLGRVCDALADAAEEVRREERRPLRFNRRPDPDQPPVAVADAVGGE